MFRPRLAFAAALVVGSVALPLVARAQYGGTGMGSALSADALSHQSNVRAGIDDVSKNASKETPFKIIKDVKQGLKDADPNVRVQELKKLRDLQDPEVNNILMDSLSDPDIRVKIKAVDMLGAREANGAVGAISQLLFLRSTEPLLKLHSTAALGRIGDTRGTLPVMQFLEEERAAGTTSRLGAWQSLRSAKSAMTNPPMCFPRSLPMTRATWCAGWPRRPSKKSTASFRASIQLRLPRRKQRWWSRLTKDFRNSANSIMKLRKWSVDFLLDDRAFRRG